MSNTITLLSGNLFALGAEVYQDPSQWIRVMTANGLTDPFLAAGEPAILVLPAPDPNAGVPTAGISTPMQLASNELGVFDAAIFDESIYI